MLTHLTIWYQNSYLFMSTITLRNSEVLRSCQIHGDGYIFLCLTLEFYYLQPTLSVVCLKVNKFTMLILEKSQEIHCVYTEEKAFTQFFFSFSPHKCVVMNYPMDANSWGLVPLSWVIKPSAAYSPLYLHHQLKRQPRCPRISHEIRKLRGKPNVSSLLTLVAKLPREGRSSMASRAETGWVRAEWARSATSVPLPTRQAEAKFCRQDVNSVFG